MEAIVALIIDSRLCFHLLAYIIYAAHHLIKVLADYTLHSSEEIIINIGQPPYHSISSKIYM